MREIKAAAAVIMIVLSGACAAEGPQPNGPGIPNAEAKALAEPKEKLQTMFRKPTTALQMALPDSRLPMASPGSSFPGPSELLPPTSLPPRDGSTPSGGPLPTGLPPLPHAAPTVQPGNQEPVQALPSRPVLSATFAGQTQSIVAGGKSIRPGERLPKSDLSLVSVSRGTASLSDGTVIEIGDEIPEKAKKTKSAGKGGL